MVARPSLQIVLFGFVARGFGVVLVVAGLAFLGWRRY
jgi:hypothetical protein